MISVLDAARSGYGVGLCLLPTRDDGSKAPDAGLWTDFKKTRPTIEKMRTFDFAHRSGFGMIAGPVSGDRECWDFDCPEVYHAFVDQAIACGLGLVVDRIRANYEDATPGGGRRWIVKYPESIEWHDVALARRPKRPEEKSHP